MDLLDLLEDQPSSPEAGQGDDILQDGIGDIMEDGIGDMMEDKKKTENFPPPPPYANLQGQTTAPARTTFPPFLNGYLPWMISRTIYLGRSAEEKLFAATLHTGGLTGKKPTVILYNGPTDKHPVLAMAGNDHWKRTKYAITLPAGPGRGADLLVNMGGGTLTRPNYEFSIVMGSSNRYIQEEKFEWRSSSGEELMSVGKHNSWDWKLVRLTGQNTTPYETYGERGPSFAASRYEVVALLACSSSASMTKVLRFAFCGTGLTGSLGNTWEIAALTSALQIWWATTQKVVKSLVGS